MSEATRSFTPIPVLAVEIAGPLPAEELLPPRSSVLFVVTLHGVPMGQVRTLTEDYLARDDEQRRRWLLGQFAPGVRAHLLADGLLAPDADAKALAALALDEAAPRPCAPADAEGGPLVSVVIPTTGRCEQLPLAVASALAQTYRPLEVVVVDNRPATGEVRARLGGISDPRLRIVAEPRIGLSHARNCGVAQAQGDVIAFTDDDAIADPSWVARLAATFQRSSEVDCVTGLVLPAELRTPEQVWFDSYGALRRVYTTTVWTQRPDTAEGHESLAGLGVRGEGGPAFPFTPGRIGSGNNMAFRRKSLELIGGFDPALGAGSIAGGGEDLDAFLAVLLSDGVIVHEPAAYVRHHHRSSPQALRRQMYLYGSGLSALITKHLVTSAGARSKLLLRVPAGLHYLVAPRSAKNAGRAQGYPSHLRWHEWAGLLSGPWRYAAGALAARLRARGSAPVHPRAQVRA
ncbi:MAG: glycosyltransferase family 2 protein [Kineosporiaceae bacterium]